MKFTYSIIVILILSLNMLGQNPNVKKIDTGNSLDISYGVFSDDLEEEYYNLECVIPAEFPGGYDSLASYVRANWEYPQSAINDSVQGRVLTYFVVDTCGNIKFVKIETSARYDLDSVCYYGIKSLPKFIPGRDCRNNLVPISFSWWIHFVLGE